MLPWSATASFFVFAAIVQAVFGTAILVRRPRSEPAIVLAALFWANAGESVAAVFNTLAGGDPDLLGYARRTRYYFDKTSTYLVAYLALCYPYRPAWLVSRPLPPLAASPGAPPPSAWRRAWWSVRRLDARARWWYLPVLVLGPLTASLVAAAVDGAAIFGPHGSTYNYDGAVEPLGFLNQTVLTSFPFTILLARWSYLLVHERSPVLLRQFRLVFAAFAVRAAHINLQLGIGNFYYHPPETLQGFQDWTGAGLRALQLAAVVATFVYLIVQRERVTTDRRRSIDFVLAFLFLGALEVFPVEPALQRSLFNNPLQHLDVVVLRPVLLYFAIVRYDIIGLRFRSIGLGAAILAAVSLPAFFVGTLPTFERFFGVGPLALALSAAAAALLTLAIILLLIPYLRAQGDGQVAPKVEEYVAALEDLHRNAQATPERVERLEPLRISLGITQEQAGALQEAVATRWATGKGPWRPGTKVRGRYEVVRMLGEGANAMTFLARDLLADRDVVLKRLRRLDDNATRALLHEAYQLARLDHPNVVRFVRTEDLDGEPVLVLEHLPRGSLATRLAERGKLPPDEVARIGRDVLAGLAAAHQVGVIHRDVKPSNILFDDAGRAKLCDFGIARSTAAAPRALGDPTPTSSQGAGTLRYMAPEQVRGLAPDERSDVYAAGVVLYEAATGEHPVRADMADYAMRRHIVEGPSPVVPRQLPEPLRRALRRMLEKDPAKRPRTAAQAVAELPGATPRGTAAGSARPG